MGGTGPIAGVFRFCGLALAGCLLLLVALPPSNQARTAELSQTSAPVEDSDLLASLGHFRAARIQNIIEDVDAACIKADARSGKSEAARILSRLVHTVRQSPVGAWLLEVATQRRVLICLDTRTELGAYYRSQVRLIGVKAALNEARQVAFLTHELAHVVQHPLYSNNRNFPPAEMLLLRRMREASAEAVATRVLWELSLSGEDGPWQEKQKTHYKDIAQSFERTWRATDPSLDRAKIATRAAFDRWFALAWRRDFYDDMSLDHLSNIAKDDLGLVEPYLRLSEGFLSGIAWYGGANFLADRGHRSLLGPEYAGRLSDQNSKRLAHFEALTPGVSPGLQAAR